MNTDFIKTFKAIWDLYESVPHKEIRNESFMNKFVRNPGLEEILDDYRTSMKMEIL